MVTLLCYCVVNVSLFQNNAWPLQVEQYSWHKKCEIQQNLIHRDPRVMLANKAWPSLGRVSRMKRNVVLPFEAWRK